MTRFPSMVCLAVLLLPAVSAADPAVRWSPQVVTETVSLGSTKSFELEIASNSLLTNVQFRVVPALAKYVSVEPPIISRLEPGVVLPVTLLVDFTSLTEPIKLDGVVQVESTVAGKNKKSARPLPVVLIGEPQSSDIVDTTLFSGVGDPLWLQLTSQNGDVVTAGGTRDADGFPTLLEAIQYRSLSGENGQILFSPEGLPQSATLEDGSRLTFFWTDETHVVVSVLTADGLYQANVELDLTTLPAEDTGSVDLTNPISSGLLQAAVATPSVRTGAKPPLSLTSSVATREGEALDGTAALAAVGPATGVVEVRVQSSATGSPVTGADVDVCINRGVIETTCPWVREAGTGQYLALFQNAPDAIPDDLIESYCTSIASNVRAACSRGIGQGREFAKQMVQGGCNQLAGAVPPQYSGAVSAACRAAFSAVVIACDVTRLGPVLCAGIDSVVNTFDPGDLDVSASARKENLSDSSSQTVPSNSTLVNFNLTLNEPDCEILNFSTSPVDPAPFQGYVATVTLGCAGAPTSSITMSVSGTDGYSDSTQCVLESTCQLSVPGADATVVDTITVLTTSGDSRSIQLVF